MSATWYEQQIKNNNYLSPIGFKFTIQKAPKTSYLCQSTSIPDISVGEVGIPTPFIRYPIEGNFQYGNFDMQFLVDENLENYLEIHNWMRALGIPYDFEERREFEDATSVKNQRNIFSDGTLEVLTNNLTSNFHVVFINMFPVSLSTLEFDATVGDNNFMNARVSFKYAYYELRTPNGGRKTMSNWNPEGS
jgi:hypothetical protein